MLRVKVNNEFSDLFYHCSDGISKPLEAGFSSETDIDTVTNVMTSPQPSVLCHSAGDEREISSMTIPQPSSSQLYNM